MGRLRAVILPVLGVQVGKDGSCCPRVLTSGILRPYAHEQLSCGYKVSTTRGRMELKFLDLCLEGCGTCALYLEH